MAAPEAIETWWQTLSPEERIDAKAAVEAGAVPAWMATALAERFGDDAVWIWVDDNPRDHPAPYRTSDELAALILSQGA